MILNLIYNNKMTLKDDLMAYQQRWALVEEIKKKERRSASMQLRWQQLNTAYGLAKGLGLIQPDPSEQEVFQRWAKLKEKLTTSRPKA